MASPTPIPSPRAAAPRTSGAEPLPSAQRLPAPYGPTGDDALSRAARDVAAPRRRLLAALRDAHAEGGERVAALRRCDAALRAAGGEELLRPALARLLGEAEEQLRRLEILFAQLRERPGAGLVDTSGPDLAMIAARRGPDHRRALLLALEAEEVIGAREAAALRDLAHLAGQHLAARLLDMTAAERHRAAEDLAAVSRLLAAEGAGATRQ
jgi:hypothetical protein